MSKVDLAKKTAKLMIDKLSPQELENELYQLLIILSNNDLDYIYEDVKKGEVAGPPHPVDVLQGSDRDDAIAQHNRQMADSSLEDEKSRESSYNQRFSLDDFVYGYDAGMDRWLPYTIHKFIGRESFEEDDKYELKEYFAGAPGDVGQEIIYYEGELKMQPEDKVFLVQDYLYKNNGKDFVKYIKYEDSLAEKDEGGQFIKDIYMDHNGIVNIEWIDKRMEHYTTQATPFWNAEDEIGVQVSHNKSGEELPFPDLDNIPKSVSWENYDSFNIGNHIYPNNPEDFYYAYWDVLPQILEISLSIVEENEDYMKEAGYKESYN